MQEKKKFQQLTSNEICQIYQLLLDSGRVSFLPTESATHKIESIVATITGTYFGKEIYETPEEKMVAYFYFIIKDHPFIDGNKRTAVSAFLTLLQLNNAKLKDSFNLDEVAVLISKISMEDHQLSISILTKFLFG